MAKSMIGIDVGVCELKIALWDGRRIKKLVAVPMPDNLVKDGIIVSYDAMADFIKQSLKGNRISAEAAVILPANYTFLKRLSLPKMTKQQLEVNLPFEFRDFLTQGKDKYFYDYAVNGFTKSEDGKEETMDLLAACAAKDVIGEYRTMLKRSKLSLSTAIPAECAFINILRAQKGFEGKEFAFVDFGHSATRLYVFKGAGYEVTRVMDLGQRTVCEAIADHFGVDEHMALNYLQNNHANCHELEGPRNVYSAIAAEIRKAVNFYSFSSGGSLTQLWVCGGGAKNAALVKQIEQETELKVMDIKELLPAVPAGAEIVSFVNAIGAAMQGGK